MSEMIVQTPLKGSGTQIFTSDRWLVLDYGYSMGRSIP